MKMRFHSLYPFFLTLSISMAYAGEYELPSKSLLSLPKIMQLGPTRDAYFVICHIEDCPRTSFKHLKTSIDVDHSDIQKEVHVQTYKEIAEQSSNSIGKIESAMPTQAKSNQKVFKKAKVIKKRKRQRSICLKKSS